MFNIKETEIYKIYTIKKKKEKSNIDKIVWWIPIKSLRNSIREIYYEFNNTNKIVNQINERADHIHNHINERIDNIHNHINEMIKNINYNSKKQIIKVENISYNLNYEIPFIMKFKDLLNDDYKDLYHKLISNLDKKSIKITNQILSRIMFIVNNNETYDINCIFSNAEIDKINNLILDFFPNIMKCNNDCYLYNKYFLPINHFEISVFYHKYNIDNLPLEYFKHKNIIDIGGFIGDSAIVFSEYTDKNVYCFEPMSKNYNNILKTISLNDLSNIIPIKKAVGKEKSTVKLAFMGSASCIMDTTVDGLEYEYIETIKLDDFINENEIDVGIIKVDIEGYEQDFLEGARETILRYKPILLLSIYHSPNDFFNIKNIIDNMNLDYNFQIYKPLDGYILLETILIAIPNICNFRNGMLNTDQTRPDQTRPDQTRPNYCICSDYIYFYHNSKYKKLQPMLQYKIAA